MNIIVWLEYELAYYDSTVHHFNHYTTRTTSLSLYIYIYIYIYMYHCHHHVVLPAWISLTLSRHSSLSFITSSRSSGLHPVSSQSCCMYVRAGCTGFARLYEGVHRSTSLMSSSLLLQHCPACLVRLTLNSFHEGRQVAVQLVLCGVLPPGLIQNYLQHSCVVAIWLFLQLFS